MAFAARFFIYILGGGALLAWVHPPRGVWEIAAVLAWIGVCTLVDTLLPEADSSGGIGSGRAGKRRSATETFRSSKRATSRDGGKRRGLYVLYASGEVEEAERLSSQLRERGLHPMVVSQRGSGSEDIWVFEVRVPEGERRRAQPILTRFSVKRAGS
jgi:hypothetical protein